MKKWKLAKAQKYLPEIIDYVLDGEVQIIEKPGGETVYLIPGRRKITNDNYPPCRALLCQAE